MDYQSIIDKYYPAVTAEEQALRHIYMVHCQLVTARALKICDLHPELGMDRRFVEEAAMLHDIGICRCDAPSIHCHGTEPYLIHGRIGAEMLREEGYERHARVCERHTGAGLTRDQIVKENLPLPHQDFLPETLEEKVICYADKFYSKTHVDREKSLEKAEHSIARFGEDGLVRFREWEKMFEGQR